ncbi:dienelactone hydrolase family protein [Streptomyces sp. 891-h]|uniref:dienelactone hydrolase family protein n=1 Tax=unclassified Streptomyces TaxID=2593676 RepID=UPI001FAB0905|nr:dienelactone hydrolase family protein [Streptomyces sp. 891-h]UNZ16094.1 dienelactone hydrolase family protein [Streptomyces sp. 891-h]
MHFRNVDIPTPDGTADAFAACPDEDGSYPPALFYMDIIGLRPVIRDMVTELASHGYYVLAPNVFYRHGRAPVVEVPDLSRSEDREAFMGRVLPLLGSHTSENAVRDAGAYLDFLTRQPQARDGKAGVTGYCMGGVLAMRTAAAYPERVGAMAGFHTGHVVTDEPDSPHRIAGQITARMHFGHAENDGSMTPENVATLNEVLDEAGADYTSEVYPGTVHGFTMADTAAFDPAALERHWERLLPLFSETLQTH